MLLRSRREPRHDFDELTYEDDAERAHVVPQDGIRRFTPFGSGPMHEPEKKTAPAHKGLRFADGPKTCAEAQARAAQADSCAHRREVFERDYDDLHRCLGDRITRGDAGVE